MSKPRSKKIDLYDLYEQSVQSPKVHADWLAKIYNELMGKYPVHFREDFAGTFQICCEWVKRNRSNTAIAIDLDSKPLNYGRKNHYSLLNADQKRRLKIIRKNAISVTKPKADLIIAGNFSFFILKKRKELIQYFKKARQSLAKDGMFLLEMAGGPGMIAEIVEKKMVHGGVNGFSRSKKFQYQWDQQLFDPITHDASYAIHFVLPKKKVIRNAFTYDWRLWTIPEVRDALEEAGFKKSIVYWETAYKGKGTGEFLPAENGDNAFSWIAYVVGLG